MQPNGNGSGNERPDKQNINSIQQERPSDVQHIKQYWTEHKTTLIAFEAQYMYAKKPEIMEELQETQQKGKKKKATKKNMAYDSGFLFSGNQNDKEINVYELVRQSHCDHLRALFQEKQMDPDMEELKQFIKIMLQLKNECIVCEFLQIYNIIVREIKDVHFEQVSKDVDRTTFLNKVETIIAEYVGAHPQKFYFFTDYMKDDRKDTIHLFHVTTYCFLAEKHNFNINQHFYEAFSVPKEEKNPSKKIKRDMSEQNNVE